VKARAVRRSPAEKGNRIEGFTTENESRRKMLRGI